MTKVTKQQIPKAGTKASTSPSPEKEMKRKLDPPDDFWMNAEELPGEGCVYGGTVQLPDGRNANVYLVMGKDDIETLEVNIIKIERRTEGPLHKIEFYSTDEVLSEEELQQKVMMGTREVTLKRHLFESIIPYFYNQPRKKIL
jgi:hypothetical protein